MTMEELKKLVQEAYEFGYFVGYKGHSEWAEWIREHREEIYLRAQELGIYEIVKEAYNKGKADGRKKREEEILKGLGKEPPEGERPRPPKIEPVEEEVEEAVPERDEVEFARFLETTRLFLPPELLNSLRNLKPPRMLRSNH